MRPINELKETLSRLSVPPEELLEALEMGLDELMEHLHDKIVEKQSEVEDYFFLTEEEEEEDE